MGKRGPRRLPTEIKLARGTYRKDRQGDVNEQPQFQKIQDAPPPDSLGEHGRARWLAVLPLLVQANVLTVIDLCALEQYCKDFDKLAVAESTIASDGRYIETMHGIKPHPAILDEARINDRIRRREADFGLTPSARTGLKVTEKPKGGIVPRRRA